MLRHAGGCGDTLDVAMAQLPHMNGGSLKLWKAAAWAKPAAATKEVRSLYNGLSPKVEVLRTRSAAGTSSITKRRRKWHCYPLGCVMALGLTRKKDPASGWRRMLRTTMTVEQRTI